MSQQERSCWLFYFHFTAFSERFSPLPLYLLGYDRLHDCITL